MFWPTSFFCGGTEFMCTAVAAVLSSLGYEKWFESLILAEIVQQYHRNETEIQ